MTITQLGAGRRSLVDAGWRERAACQFMAPELFFPTGSTGAAVEEIIAAKAICLTCPVQDACLRFALETKQEDGIWGGTTEEERRRLRRSWMAERRRAADRAGI